MNVLWQDVFQIVLAVVSSTLLATLVQARRDRRKTLAEAPKVKADTADVLSETALEQVAAMKKDLDETREAVRSFRSALRDHEEWDRMVLRELYSLGRTDIPNPPELWI